MGIYDLVEKMKSDPEIAKKYKALLDLKPFVEEARKDGFTITVHDVVALLQKLSESSAPESANTGDTPVSFIAFYTWP